MVAHLIGSEEVTGSIPVSSFLLYFDGRPYRDIVVTLQQLFVFMMYPISIILKRSHTLFRQIRIKLWKNLIFRDFRDLEMHVRKMSL